MIVKISSRGKSFKGLATYLTHDAKAETAERVGWTHTLNCANDHIASAVDEMVWTARNAELLKQEAGIRAGGRATEKTVLHASLNWSPDDQPTCEHMIETAQAFLEHMGWDERQAIFVGHTDKTYSHVHIMLNAIHPETGLCLDDSFEQRRGQAWALEYERENDRIYCEQRLLNAAEREDAPTRPAWMAFKNQEKEFENAEKLIQENNRDFFENENNPENIKDAEWKKLKEIQRHERETFFAEGRTAFSELRTEIYREVREDFRERWADLYAAQKDGADISEIKAKLIADQKAALETRRDEACQELRETRDETYRELLLDQRGMRLNLHARQAESFDNAIFFQHIENKIIGQEAVAEFRENGEALTMRVNDGFEHTVDDPFSVGSSRDSEDMRSGTTVADKLGEGIGLSLISFMESIADGLMGAKPAPKPRAPEPDIPRANPFEAVAKEERQRLEREQEESDEWRKKQRSYGE